MRSLTPAGPQVSEQQWAQQHYTVLLLQEHFQKQVMSAFYLGQGVHQLIDVQLHHDQSCVQEGKQGAAQMADG